MLNGSPLEISNELVAQFGVEEVGQERMAAVADFDLAYVTQDLSDDLIRTGRAYSCEQAYPLMFQFGKVDLRLASRLEVEFKRFCILTLLEPSTPHAPPGAVDMYWHFFILHTRQYVDFCERAWGNFDGEPRFRDHFPSKDATRPGMLEAYRATRELYVTAYGEPEPFRVEGITRQSGEVLPVAPKPIWVEASDTSGDSYSGIVEPVD